MFVVPVTDSIRTKKHGGSVYKGGDVWQAGEWDPNHSMSVLSALAGLISIIKCPSCCWGNHKHACYSKLGCAT